ncbi:MAG: hypothetical protein ACRD8Z_11725, partial [Nitrososphaeraceae archaeon]
MKRLKQITMNDENVEVEIGSVYEEACRDAGSPGGIGSYDSTNQTLRNRVLQELFGREFIRCGTTDGKVTIAYTGKSRRSLFDISSLPLVFDGRRYTLGGLLHENVNGLM